MPNHASTSLCHPTEVRALTLKEYAAIQEFPSNWEFSGKPSQQYAQVGNAVPVRLGRVAGEVVAAAMDKLEQKSWRSASRKAEEFRIIYIQSHIRTRSWYKGGETMVWEDGEKNEAVRYSSPVVRRKQRALAGR